MYAHNILRRRNYELEKEKKWTKLTSHKVQGDYEVNYLNLKSIEEKSRG